MGGILRSAFLVPCLDITNKYLCWYNWQLASVSANRARAGFDSWTKGSEIQNCDAFCKHKDVLKNCAVSELHHTHRPVIILLVRFVVLFGCSSLIIRLNTSTPKVYFFSPTTRLMTDEYVFVSTLVSTVHLRI